MASGPIKEIQRGVTLGSRPCVACGKPVAVKVNSGAHAYAYCNATAGGCGCSIQNRGDAGTVWLVGSITEWKAGRKAEVAHLLTDPPPRDPAPEPQPEPEPEPHDEPEPDLRDLPDNDPDDDEPENWWER